MTTYNIENFTIRTLLSPSIQIYLILSKVDDDKRSRLLGALINDDLKTIIDVVEDVTINTDDSTPEDIILKLNARSFLSELRNSFAHIRDLHYHKDDNDAMVLMNIVSNVLEKHKIEDAGVIAKEVYSELFVRNTKARAENLGQNEKDIKFNLKLQKQYANKSGLK